MASGAVVAPPTAGEFCRLPVLAPAALCVRPCLCARVAHLKVLVDAVLGALPAKARLLDPAEGRGLGGDAALVEAHHPVLQRLRHAPRARQAARVKVGRQACASETQGIGSAKERGKGPKDEIQTT